VKPAVTVQHTISDVTTRTMKRFHACQVIARLRCQPGELGKCPVSATLIFPANSYEASIGVKSAGP